MKDFEITYIKKDGYFYPDLKLPKQHHYPIGKYGMLHLEFLKKHRRGTYTALLADGTLNDYLHNIDVEAKNMLHAIITQTANERGMDEHFKAQNQLLWAAEMNAIKQEAEEILSREVLYI